MARPVFSALRNVLGIDVRLSAPLTAYFSRLTAAIFLSYSHLPLTLLASFLKRLARLSLSAPPAAIVIVIPFTYNVLKQHPGLMVMIHRPEGAFPSLPALPFPFPYLSCNTRPGFRPGFVLTYGNISIQHSSPLLLTLGAPNPHTSLAYGRSDAREGVQ